MRNRIVFGRYVAADSWVHELDPRSKTLGILIFMAIVFMIDSYWGVLAVLVFSLLVMRSTQVPLTHYARAIKPLLFILFFIVLFHLVVDPGRGRIIDVGPFTFYSGGLGRGMIAASRMILFVTFAALLSFTTQPQRLAQGLESLLKPLRYLGISPDKLGLMISIALRFIPTVFDEAERIWKAQVSRGLDLRKHSLKRRAGHILALLVPVTAGAFRRAMELADSMEARGYRLGARRSAYKMLEWKRQDTFYLSLFLLPLIAVLFI